MKILFSIALSCITLFSSLNMVISQHFCQDQLRSLSFFGEAETCHDPSDDTMKQCPMHPNEAVDRDNCCENQSFELNGQELDVTVPQYTIEVVLPAVIAIVTEFIQLPEVTETYHDILLANHDPPDRADIFSLIQVYRL